MLQRLFGTLLGVLLLSTNCLAAIVELSDSPLNMGQDVPPMVMLVMSRDHTLYYEAYNDASDLNGDGELDTRYKPNQIDYAGYFDSHKCYSYGSDLFTPISTTSNKQCDGAWSGDFLNYLTMSRIDLLRQVLYGGLRSTDTGSNTVLERAFIPQDAHSWGKSYTSVAVDGYDLTLYTPLSKPETGGKHFFGTASFSNSGKPQIRVRLNQKPKNEGETCDIWDWASTERPVLANDPSVEHGKTVTTRRFNRETRRFERVTELIVSYNCTPYGPSDHHYTVRVAVCVEGLLENNCKEYPGGNFKPAGLLHEYGEKGEMEFGLLTGSFAKNLSGGVLRRTISNFADELNQSDGTFKSGFAGIVNTIDALRVQGFDANSKEYHTNCGWVANGPISNGTCSSWGNPVGEMLYESTRYFQGEGSPSSSYYTGSEYGLQVVPWNKPYESHEYCARANNLVISDINPNYDADDLPSDVSGWISEISTQEGISGNFFIGKSTADSSGGVGAPTAKRVTNLNGVQGLAPQEPTKGGSYSSAGVAYYGRKTDLFPDKSGLQSIHTSVVAISSPLPEIKIDIDGHTVMLVPYAKSVNGFGISPDKSLFQPTNTIVDYYVKSITPTSGEFRINFEDVEQGADHDMDMIVTYRYEVFDRLCPSPEIECSEAQKRKGIRVTLTSDYAAGVIEQHAGYVISGTESDGIYLEVRDVDTPDGSATPYYLDTVSPTDKPYPNNLRTIGSDSQKSLELTKGTRVRHFFPNQGTPAATFLPSPLLYAAKYGGFIENSEIGNSDQKPNLKEEWDSDGDEVPDSYFPVTNAGELGENLKRALDKIAENRDTAGKSIFNSHFMAQGAMRFQSSYENETWSGDVKAYGLSDAGEFSATAKWKAAELLDAKSIASRNIFSRNDESKQVFEFLKPSNESAVNGNANSFSKAQVDALLDGAGGTNRQKLRYLQAVVNYLLGSRYHEADDRDYSLRKRTSILGDVVNSTPYLVDKVNGHSVSKPVLVFGANDGMVHILNASTGDELAAYVPSQVYKNLGGYVKSTYQHKFFVDGNITGYTDDSGKTTVVGTLGHGAKGLYAIDVTDMSSPSKAMMKWEITSSADFSGIGYTRAQPTIAKLANGKVGVIFPNGYNAGEDGTLYIANIEDGSLIAKLSTGVTASQDPTGNSRPNAMAEPGVIDLNADGIADRIYAGDLYGNLWVFDITSGDPANWKLATTDNKPLFSAVSPTKDDGVEYIAQPITSRPSFTIHPNGYRSKDETNKVKGVLISFGTGLYAGHADASALNQPTQSFYVIWDKLDGTRIEGSRTSSDGGEIYAELLNQQILKEDEGERVLTENKLDWDIHRGVYIDLINTEGENQDNRGERQVTTSLSLIDKVTFTTLIPNSDICSSGGEGWYMELDLHTGRVRRTYLLDEIPPPPSIIIEPPAKVKELINGTDDSETQGCTEDCGPKEVIFVGDKDFKNNSLPVGMLNWRRMY